MCIATSRACAAGGIAPFRCLGMQPHMEGGPHFGSPQRPKWADYTAKLVVRGGVEPPAFRFSGAFAASLHVAGCRLMGNLAAQTMAGCRLAWPDICGRCLPVWLPLELEDLTSPSAEPARVRQARPLMKGRRSPRTANSMTFAGEGLGRGFSRSNARFADTRQRVTCQWPFDTRYPPDSARQFGRGTARPAPRRTMGSVPGFPSRASSQQGALVSSCDQASGGQCEGVWSSGFLPVAVESGSWCSITQ
jgi:hypothetical protein